MESSMDSVTLRTPEDAREILDHVLLELCNGTLPKELEVRLTLLFSVVGHLAVITVQGAAQAVATEPNPDTAHLASMASRANSMFSAAAAAEAMRLMSAMPKSPFSTN
jgi:hypothetical protein